MLDSLLAEPDPQPACSLEEAAQRWLNTKRSRSVNTRAMYSNCLKVFVEFGPTWPPTAAEIDRYMTYLYDVRNGAERVLRGHTEYIKSLSFSPDSTQLATAGIDGRIRLWDTTTGAEIRVLAGHWQNVDDAVFSPDGLTLASIESRTCLKLWRLDTFLEVTSITMPDAGEHLVFSPTGDRVAVVRVDNRVTFLDARPVP